MTTINNHVTYVLPLSSKGLTGRLRIYVEHRWPSHIANGKLGAPNRVRTFRPKYSDTIRFLVNGR